MYFALGNLHRESVALQVEGRKNPFVSLVSLLCVYVLYVGVSVRKWSLPTDSNSKGPFAPVPARYQGHLALRVGARPVEYLV